MAFEQKNNSGALFKNEDKEDGDNLPDYTGSCTIDGEKLYIGAWIKKSKEGDKYMSLSFNPPQSKGAKKAPASKFDDMDDDIPF